jgi:hypothetical protein
MKKVGKLIIMMMAAFLISGCAWFKSNQQVINVLADTAASVAGCEFAKAYPNDINQAKASVALAEVAIASALNPQDAVKILQAKMVELTAQYNDPYITIGITSFLELINVPLTGPLTTNADVTTILVDAKNVLDAYSAGMATCTPAKLAAQKAKVAKLKMKMKK